MDMHTQRDMLHVGMYYTPAHTDTCTQRYIYTCLSTQRCTHSKTHTQDMHSHISEKKKTNVIINQMSAPGK